MVNENKLFWVLISQVLDYYTSIILAPVINDNDLVIVRYFG